MSCQINRRKVECPHCSSPILNWTNLFKIDMDKWPKLKEYMARVAARPAAKEAMKAEGLVN